MDKIDGNLEKLIFNGIIYAFGKLTHFRIDKMLQVTWLKLLKVIHVL